MNSSQVSDLVDSAGAAILVVVASTLLFWVFGRMQAIADGIHSRRTRRRLLRMQKFLSRGRYFFAGRGSSLAREPPKALLRGCKWFSLLIAVLASFVVIRDLCALLFFVAGHAEPAPDHLEP